MGYQTVRKVPTLFDYDHAHRWWNNTKPIRGRDNDLRPLAERRYADCYNIRKNPHNDAIECVLYQTPVVTFMPDGEIHIRNGGWATTSTHMFINEILRGGMRDIRGMGGRTGGVLSSGQSFTLGRDEVLRLKRDENTRLYMVNEQTHYDYRVNRKKANNVRSRYTEFRTYLNGFLSLRSQAVQSTDGESSAVGCTLAEATEAVGTAEWAHGSTTYKTLQTGTYPLLDKPNPNKGPAGYYGRAMQRYENTMASFLALITSEQPEETKHQNYYKAAVMLCVYDKRIQYVTGIADMNSMVWVNPDHVKRVLDTALLKYHADEVLEKYELEKGKLPNGKYKTWIAEEK